MAKDTTKLKPAVRGPAENPYSKTITLSDGRKAEISRAKGKHIMEAADIVKSLYGSTPSDMQMQNCIVSRVCKIDGENINPDTLTEMWANDWTAVQAAFGEIAGGL